MHSPRYPRLIAAPLMILLLLATGCASMADIVAGQTPIERDLQRLASSVRARAQQQSNERQQADHAVLSTLSEAQRIWNDSPSRSSAVFSNSGYELSIVYRAVADYYVSTGRTGLAIPVIEEAATDARSFRYYTDWQNLSLELVTLYQRVGMLDHARDRIENVLQFLARFGHTLDHPPDQLDRDTVVFLTLHVRQMEIRPDAYRDAAIILRLYDLFTRSIETTPEAWGWDPGSGYRYVPMATVFAVRLAELGDRESARHIKNNVAALHRHNRSQDPFVLANERGLDSLQSQLGRDLHRVLNVPFAAGVFPLSVRIQDRPAHERRYLARDPFVENIENARIAIALSDHESALAAADQATKSLGSLEAFYARVEQGLSAKDGFLYETRALVKIRAVALESLARYRESEALFESYIAWSERERTSLPLEQRIHFFRGQARSAYLGSIRCSVAQYLESRDPAELDRVLAKAERLRARGFQDLLGQGADSAPIPTLRRMQGELDSEEGILQLIDLHDRIVTILLTRKNVRVQMVLKTDGWDREIFRLRNQLAQSMIFDRRAFESIGLSLLGFAAKDLDSLSRLYVTLTLAVAREPEHPSPPSNHRPSDPRRRRSQLRCRIHDRTENRKGADGDARRGLARIL